MWNKLQPKRQSATVNSRTHISHPESRYNPYLAKNMVAQLKLYNWCCGLDYVNGAPIADLHAYLVEPGSAVTMRQIGMTILQAVSYDPRKLKARTLDNDRARKIFVFKDPLDLKHGLEWMMSMWIYGYEWTYEDLIRQDDYEEIMLEIFNDIGACESDILDEKYVSPVWQDNIYDWDLYTRKPDWPALWAKFGWEKEPAPMERAPKRELRGLV